MPRKEGGQGRSHASTGRLASDEGHRTAGWTTRDVLSVGVYAGSVDDAVRTVIDHAANRGGGYSCLCGAHLLTLGRRRQDVRAALTGAWLNFPDGAPVAWLQRAGGIRHAARVAGADLMLRVVEEGVPARLSHFLFGSTPDVLERLRRRLELLFPAARVSGTFSPPFGPPGTAADPAAIEAIRSSGAHIVWVALGAPKQELWMHRNVAQLRPALALGVGAAFDFISGTQVRAPLWMQRAGLEWLHRMSREPRRLVPRYLDANARFIAYVTSDLVRRRMQ